MEKEYDAARKPSQLTAMKNEIGRHAPTYIAVFLFLGLGTYFLVNYFVNDTGRITLGCTSGLMSIVVILGGVLIEKTDQSGLGILIEVCGVVMLFLSFLAILSSMVISCCMGG